MLRRGNQRLRQKKYSTKEGREKEKEKRRKKKRRN
jgi:hypothetical protein